MADDQLEPLITECPNCATRFRVTESQLEVASGRVRCGACLTVFQGTEHLLWEGGAGYPSAKQAAAALDDLLQELEQDSGSHSDVAPPEEVDPVGAAAPGADLPHPTSPLEQDFEAETRQIYVGHEEPPGSEQEAEPEQDVEPGQAAEPGQERDAATAAADVAVVAEAIGLEQPPEPSVAAETPASEDATHAAGNERDDSVAAGIEGVVAAEAETTGAAGREAIAATAAAPAESVESAAPGYAAEDAALTAAAVAAGAAAPDPLGLEPASAGEVTFAREPRRWWVGIVMLLGALVLGAQVFWYQFESWGRDPTLRPVYAEICRLAGCELPVLRDLDALRTDKLLVRSHPEFADALIVDTVIVNEAPFAQPFPALDLRFTTIDGTLVAGRLFQPEEYLAGDLAGEKMMAPNTPVRLALELKDPGGDAVSYFLSFR